MRRKVAITIGIGGCVLLGSLHIRQMWKESREEAVNEMRFELGSGMHLVGIYSDEIYNYKIPSPLTEEEIQSIEQKAKEYGRELELYFRYQTLVKLKRRLFKLP